MEVFILVGGPWNGRQIALPGTSTQLKLVLEDGVHFYVGNNIANRLEYQPFPH